MEPFHSKTGNKLIAIAIAVLWLVVLYLVLAVTRIDPEQQMAQKIFYYHVPSAWTAGIAFLVVAVSGGLYLTTRDEKWDHFGLASAELGTLFCALVLITGPIWAKPIWGAPWSWEVIGVAAFVNVPIIYVSVKFWSAEAQLHPQPAMSQQPPDVFWTFILSLLTFTFLFVHLLRYRLHVLKLQSQIARLTDDL